MGQSKLQARLVTADKITPHSTPVELALFNADGSPFTGNQTDMEPAAAQADFAGADLAALKVELNAFLAKLRTANIVETA